MYVNTDRLFKYCKQTVIAARIASKQSISYSKIYSLLTSEYIHKNSLYLVEYCIYIHIVYNTFDEILKFC